MESVLRAVLIYTILFTIFRFSGKRAVNKATPFGLILIFLISNSLSDGLKGEDKSITNGVIQACTLAVIHITLSLLKVNHASFERLIDDVPTVLVKDGELVKKGVDDSRVTVADILDSARKE